MQYLGTSDLSVKKLINEQPQGQKREFPRMFLVRGIQTQIHRHRLAPYWNHVSVGSKPHAWEDWRVPLGLALTLEIFWGSEKCLDSLRTNTVSTFTPGQKAVPFSPPTGSPRRRSDWKEARAESGCYFRQCLGWRLNDSLGTTILWLSSEQRASRWGDSAWKWLGSWLYSSGSPIILCLQQTFLQMTPTL